MMKENKNILKENINNKVVKTICLCIVLLSSNLLMAQNLDYEWAKTFGNTYVEEGYAIDVDAAGNTYSTGYFGSTVDFDPGAGTANLTSNGSNDIFVSKLDVAGNFVWAKSFGGSSFDIGYAIKVDAIGNIYIIGYFTGIVDFDPGVGITNLTALGNRDVFISKLDASGGFIWAKNFGGTSSCEGKSLSIDAVGNIYSTGNFLGTTDFDPGAGVTNLTSNGNTDIFVSKLDASGNFVWAKSYGASQPDKGFYIYADAAGNSYITGSIRNTVDFDSGTGSSNSIIVSNTGGGDIFVTKLDASGNFIWAKNMGGTGTDRGSSICVDDAGNVYTTGYYQGTGDFDPGTGVNNLSSNGSSEVFVSKLDASGDFVWAKSFGGTSIDEAMQIKLDALGNVYTTGRFSGAVDFDPGVGTDTIISNGNTDVFISKLDANGNFIWAKNLGGTTADEANSFGFDAAGNLYTIGGFRGTADFDTGAGTNDITTNGGSNKDIFVLKLSCSPTTGTQTVSACESYIFNGITYTTNNNIAKDTLINASGCDSIVTLNLTIDMLDMTITQTGNSIIANTTGATYQWLDCDNGNVIIPADTNQSYTATESGNYAVMVTNGTCTDTSACVNITIEDTINVGINDVEFSSNEYHLFPNPTTSYVTISNFDSSITHIRISDITGKVMDAFVPNSAKIDVSALNRGIYFVEIQIGEEIATRKLVKQ